MTLSEQVLALEQENEQLRAEVAKLSQPDTRDKLIDLMASDILWQEANNTHPSERMVQIIKLYREIRKK